MSTEQSHTSTERIASSTLRWWVLLALLWGWLVLLFGLGAATVTVACGSYTGVLQIAFVSTVLAAALLSFAFWRGGVVARSISALGLLPILYIVSELLRRSSFTFGW